MTGYIDNINFANLAIMHYWSPPASWSIEKKKAEIRKRIFSGEWLGAQKRDGVFYMFLKDEDGNVILRGRSESVNGGYIDKWDHLPHLITWANNIPNGTCLLGEVYCTYDERSYVTTKIMGCLTEKAVARQKEEKERMHYYIFDVLAYDGKSMLKEKALNRFQFLENNQDTLKCNYVEVAHYLSGQKLWDTLQIILGDGHEGIVITHQDGLYEPGKRPSRTTCKVKQELSETIDCFFTGRTSAPTRIYTGKELQSWPYWENEFTHEKIEDICYDKYKAGEPVMPVTRPYFYGWAGSLEIGVIKNGAIQPIGWLSGLTDEVKSHPDKYKGKCIEVGAMLWTPDYALRHGKMIQFRDDLTYKDCTWDKLGLD